MDKHTMQGQELNLAQRKQWLLLVAFLILCQVSYAANPTLTGVQIITNANDTGEWNTDTIPDAVSSATNVDLRVVVTVSGAPKTYYWGYPKGEVTGIGKVYEWCTTPWGSPGITWYKIMPSMSTANPNDPWNTGYNRYTNVVANSNSNIVDCTHGHDFSNPGPGLFLNSYFTDGSTACIPSCSGCDGGEHTSCDVKRGLQCRGALMDESGGCAIIQYSHTSVGTDWQYDVDTDTGVSHYTVTVNYDGNTYKSKGESYTTSVSNLYYSGPRIAYNYGIKDLVTRIVRLSSNSDLYIRHIEAYEEVPWIYGSVSWQARDYLGFDCADLAQAAAYRAGLDTAYENSADNLCSSRTKILSAGEPYYLIRGVLFKSDKTTHANIPVVQDGATSSQINVGDLVMIDFGGDGGPQDVDHTTVLYSGTGYLDGTDGLIFATKPGVNNSTTMSGEIGASDKIYLRRGW